MNAKKPSKFGFTLVELMTATLAFSILSLAVGSMLVYGWQGWVRNNDLVAMQRDASLTMMVISKQIRNAKYAWITDGGGMISFDDGTGVYASFSESGNNIVNDNDSMVLVAGWLEPGSFTSSKSEFANSDTDFKTNQWVEVGFTLQTTTESEDYSIKVAPRN